MSTLKEYQDLIDKMAETRSSEILPNAGADHAAIVMAKMFEKARESVNMIVGSFDGAVSNKENYLSKLEECINRKIQFKIIFLDTPNKNSKAYSLLKRKRDEGCNISFSSASADTKGKLSKGGQIKHFSVFDDDKYRFEKDTSNYLAWCCFNDKRNAANLLGIFDEALGKSIPI